MEVGDVVLYQGVHWRVLSYNRSFRLCILANWEDRIEVPDDLDGHPGNELTVVCQPSSWPFIAAPTKTNAGRIVEVTRDGKPLQPLVDWVPGNMFRSGGALFLNPALKLQTGEVLTAKHEKGLLSSVRINRGFGTGAHRKRRKSTSWKPPKPTTAYDRLMSDDDPYE